MLSYLHVRYTVYCPLSYFDLVRIFLCERPCLDTKSELLNSVESIGFHHNRNWFPLWSNTAGNITLRGALFSIALVNSVLYQLNIQTDECLKYCAFVKTMEWMENILSALLRQWDCSELIDASVLFYRTTQMAAKSFYYGMNSWIGFVFETYISARQTYNLLFYVAFVESC